MMTTIDFDGNFSLMSGEVREIRTDRRLPSKVMLLEWRLTQTLPELLFGFSRVTTQRASARNALVNGTLRVLCHPPPTPDPSPPRASRAGGGAKLCALYKIQIQNRLSQSIR
jgi:hypothetical protein